MAERDVDVVVFGASSVTGRRVAAYLAKRSADSGLSWAAAGRDPARIATVLDGEGVKAPATIAADVADPDSLLAMASRGKVVLNLVGPYTLHGRPVIEACVAGGAHYVDLSGEIPFVRRVISEFHEPALAAGVKVVQVCGFEALPPDLAVLSLAEAARDRWDEALAEVEVTITTTQMPAGMPRPSDFVSGGTLQSLAEALDDDDAACVTDPGCLVPDPARAAEVRGLSPIQVGPRRGPHGQAVAPMAPAAFINPAVIQRTAAFADSPLAPFRYREGVAIPGPAATLPLRLGAAGALSGVQLASGRLARAGPGSRSRAAAALRRVLPSSGYGPAPDRIEDWRWRLDVTARTGAGRTLGVDVEGLGHPGYLTTARMLGEAGLMLATAGATPQRSGWLTPALALGTDGIDRFDAAGLCFSAPIERSV